MHRTHGFDTHSELERALHSLGAFPVTLQRQRWPVDNPGDSASPPADPDPLHPDSISSPKLSREPGSGDAGLQALTAFRAALQLRESQLLPPQHVSQDEALGHTLDSVIPAPQHAFSSESAQQLQPSEPAVLTEQQQVEAPLPEATFRVDGNCSRELSGSRSGSPERQVDASMDAVVQGADGLKARQVTPLYGHGTAQTRLKPQQVQPQGKS